MYKRDIITTRCNELNITWKRCSKEAYDEFSESSLWKLRWFKTLPPPLGVHGIPVWSLIDIDETGMYVNQSHYTFKQYMHKSNKLITTLGFYLSDCSSNYGRGYSSCMRVRIPAHYKRTQRKVKCWLE